MPNSPYRDFANRMQEFMDSFYPITMAGEVVRDQRYPPKLSLTLKSGTFTVEEKYFTSVSPTCVLEMMQNVMWNSEGHNMGSIYWTKSDRLVYIMADSIDATEPKEIWSLNIHAFRENMKDVFFVKDAYELYVYGKEAEKKSLNLSLSWDFLKSMNVAVKLL
ncbi:MAG: hypothetical protein KCHDKBKB_00741 [Elusimicrobia bacterium]|nr:hypothetical protein [Elusimicrobiota bacterium]